MKRTETGTPYLSWCLIVRNCSGTLEACLRSVRERTPQAEIVIVDTMSSDNTVEIARRYADVFDQWRGPRGSWTTEMAAFDDAAAARQRSFELAHGVWRAWIDADDILLGPDESERLLKLNSRWQPQRRNQKVESGEGDPITLEDLLRRLEKTMPEATCVWAPYLYQRDTDDTAITWQDRERIVRWGDPAEYRWAEAAHEILVPIDRVYPPRVDFAHLLFVHEKKFTGEDYDYNLKRHFAIFLKQYNENERTTRRSLYLANQCKFVGCPEREMEFARSAYEEAKTKIDRYRAVLGLAGYYSDRGLYRDFIEHIGAAVALLPDLPDAYVTAADYSMTIKDYEGAVSWLRKALATDGTNPISYVNPRHLDIRYPTLLSMALQKVAEKLIKQHNYAGANALYLEAVDMARKVLGNDAIGTDATEASARMATMENAALAHQQAMKLRELWKFLVDNDETEKAAKLVESVPHMLVDHPIVIEIETWARKIHTHMTDPVAYRDFYKDDQVTGLMPTPKSWLRADEVHLPRTGWITAWLQQHKPEGVVLDLGCCDGIVGVPVMRNCPGIRYVGLDVGTSVVEIFRKNLVEYKLDDRAEVYQITKQNDVVAELSDRKLPLTYDAIIWSEVIEHVPDPVRVLRMIGSILKPDGLLFITTPWGSFDAGHPPATTGHGTPRDPRGHLRVITAREMDSYLTAAGLDAVDLTHFRFGHMLGDPMHVVARRRTERASSRPRSVAFAVPGALWDWNGRTTEQEGIGASEEMIVLLGQRLAPDRRVEVYGPTPDPDVCRGVRYWPREQLRHLRGTDAKLVVSRYPAFAPQLDEFLGDKLPKLLWLQDAIYNDLNAQVAERYEKIIVVSQWHKQEMHKLHGVPLDKMQVLYNFVVPDHFQNRPSRKKHKFIYASSPDRGLATLAQFWPKIRAKYSEAELHVFYGWKGCEVLGGGADDNWAIRHETMRRAYETYRFTPGIVEHGMVPWTELAQHFMESNLWLYPTAFEETGCACAVKARAAGCIPITSSLAALNETAKCDLSMLLDPKDERYEEKFLQAIDDRLDVSEQDRARMAEEAFAEYSISAMLPIWKELLG